MKKGKVYEVPTDPKTLSQLVERLQPGLPKTNSVCGCMNYIKDEYADSVSTVSFRMCRFECVYAISKMGGSMQSCMLMDGLNSSPLSAKSSTQRHLRSIVGVGLGARLRTNLFYGAQCIIVLIN